MKRTVRFLTVAFVVTAVSNGLSWDGSTPLIIDHTCTDLSQIPDAWIDSVQANMRMYYVHTSHGGQLTDGLESLESDDYNYAVAIGNETLPLEHQALCVYDKIGDPKDYWWGDEWKNGPQITRQVLTNNPTINVATFCWCSQMCYQTEAYVSAYFDSIAMLENEFPNVTFVYMTGNAQNSQERGYNRYLRNEQMRQYCKDNNKVLFDFADLDAWWFNEDTDEWEQGMLTWEGHSFPVAHQKWEGDDCGHAGWACCRQKAKAVWWMMARLVGWKGSVFVDEQRNTAPRIFYVSENYPNPFDLSTSINYNLPSECSVEVAIYNIQGQLVWGLVRTEQAAGMQTLVWNGRDDSGERVGSGPYFLRLVAGVHTVTRKLYVMR